MSDYGLLNKVRSILQNSPLMKEKGLNKSIFVTLPPEQPESMVTLELEEIWHSMKTGVHTPHVRVKFKASSIGRSSAGTDALHTAESIRTLIDGQTIKLHEGQNAVLRLANSVVDMPRTKVRRSVHQYYEALIR